MEQNFNQFIESLQPTNQILKNFTDFNKVRQNTGKVAIKLNQLNYLLGKKDLEGAIRELWDENPSVFEVLCELVAVRSDSNQMAINNKGAAVPIEHFFKTVDGVIEFVNETGLGDVFRDKAVTNLVDYVFGVEVGLDSNGRKNRGGKMMVEMVSNVFETAGIKYKTEINNSDYPEIASLGADIKRFDFVIETKNKVFLVEANFYNGGGSKLNEVCRSYTDIAPKINRYRKYCFVWITDGRGWLTTKNKLQEAFDNIPNVYNLSTLANFIELVKLSETYNI